MLKSKYLVVFVMFIFVLSGCKAKDEEALKLHETYEGDKFAITVNDLYEGDFTVPKDQKMSFDKYVVADVHFRNISDEAQTAQTMLHFEMEDDVKRHDITIDENDKKYSHVLEAGETWDISLVFAVDDQDAYDLYYSEGFKEDKEDAAHWHLDASNLEKKKVDTTVKHNKLGSTKEVER